ncbi:MAG: hypothetical protein QOK10_2165 [Pseudonocardiales bacterium]|nr:hypothetical protein [Pseudonocardiales bacterium]
MRKSIILVGAAAAAGLVALGGSAFTGSGLSTSGTAASPQFIGGTVSQSVTGATLTAINYGFTDVTNTSVNTIALTFATTADGRTVAAVPSGGAGGTFACSDILNNASSCTFAPATAETGYTGLTSLAVTVS